MSAKKKTLLHNVDYNSRTYLINYLTLITELPMCVILNVTNLNYLNFSIEFCETGHSQKVQSMRCWKRLTFSNKTCSWMWQYLGLRQDHLVQGQPYLFNKFKIREGYRTLLQKQTKNKSFFKTKKQPFLKNEKAGRGAGEMAHMVKWLLASDLQY